MRTRSGMNTARLLTLDEAERPDRAKEPDVWRQLCPFCRALISSTDDDPLHLASVVSTPSHLQNAAGSFVKL